MEQSGYSVTGCVWIIEKEKEPAAVISSLMNRVLTTMSPKVWHQSSWMWLLVLTLGSRRTSESHLML